MSITYEKATSDEAHAMGQQGAVNHYLKGGVNRGGDQKRSWSE